MTQERTEADLLEIARNRRKLVLIFSIGIVPMIIAYALFNFMPGFAPTGTTNEGYLITPPLQISDYEPKLQEPVPLGRWLLIIPVGSVCDKNCEEVLYLTRQVNIALGKEQPRVNRLAMINAVDTSGFSEDLLSEHPTLQLRFYPEHDVLVSLRRNTPHVDSTVVYLMDPNGNIMMAYTKENLGKPLLKDLKHLLKLSNIG